MADWAGLSKGWGHTAPFRNNGAGGVDLFFAISGAIIYETANRQHSSAGDFLLRRFHRLAPMHVLFTGTWLALALILPLAARPTEILASLTLWPVWRGIDTPLIDAEWTLCFEVIFYLGFALTLAWRRSIWLLLAAFAAAWMGGRLTGFPALQVLGNPLVLEFLGGVLIARYWPRTAPWWFSAFVFALGLWGLLVPEYPREVYDYVFNMDGSSALWRVGAVGLPALAVLAGGLGLEHLMGRGWALPLVFIGDASYAIYLADGVLLKALTAALKHTEVSAMAAMILGSLAAIAIGCAAHIWIDRPIQRRLRSPRTLGRPLLGQPSPTS
jgi:exopolysaccharide production protein ExoZ